MNNPGGLPPTPETTREAILKDYYDRALGATTIARNHGVDKKTVYNILAKFGKGTRQWSMPDEGPKFDVAPGILKGITPTGVKRGGQRGVKLAVNEHAFDVLTPESSYWIGFLMADGCINRDGEGRSLRLMLNLTVKDRAHLERFKGWLGSDHAIYEQRHLDPAGKLQHACCLQVASEGLCVALGKWGVVPRKTGCESPSTELLNDRHFWRGCVDGDGSVYPEAKRVYLSGGLTIVTEWKDWASRVSGSEVHVRQHFGTPGGKGCWVGDCWKHADARRLLSALYQEGDLFLPRKAEPILTYLKNQGA